MRKGLIVLLVAVVAVAFALPAMADMTPTNLKVSGFYRSKAWVSNFFGKASLPVDNTDTTSSFVEQRFRLKFALGNENVQAVWFLESDMNWGDSAGGLAPGAAARNVGGALGGDKVQTETKNVYVWFKVPDTSLDFTVGLQSQSDVYAGLIYGGADMAGIFSTGKYEPVTWKLGFAKLYENATQVTDDVTLYVAETKFAPAKDIFLGLNFYFLQHDANESAGSLPGATLAGFPFPGSARVYMPGITASFKAGPATISGFGQYQFGTIEIVGSPDIDISAYLLDLRADLNLGPGKFFFEGLYLSGGDLSGNDYEAPITLATIEGSPGGNSAYSRTNTHILMSSPDTIGVSQCLIGCSGGIAGSDPGNRGRGMWHVAAGYSQLLTPKLKGEINAGYLAATDTLVSDGNRDEEMGTEFNARLDYNLAKGLDVGVIGAYAIIGDFFQNAAGQTPEDVWMGVARVNYAF